MLYVGAIIENSAFHTGITMGDGGGRDWGPVVDPSYLADLLWTMHSTKQPPEVSYPETMLPR